jgi:protease-4
MSGVAASGGYYIACEADTIIAQSTTITGSIGVIGMGFNFHELYNKIGINKEVIKRGEFSDFLTQSRQWTEEEHEKMKKSIEYFYKEFKNRVIGGRPNLIAEELDELALGRVWSGTTALENGLIDEIGGINKTIEIAKNMANLNEQDVEIVEFPNNEKNKYNKKDKEQLDYKTQLFLELMPENIQKELNELNIIPLLKDEKIYFMLPYHIEIN